MQRPLQSWKAALMAAFAALEFFLGSAQGESAALVALPKTVLKTQYLDVVKSEYKLPGVRPKQPGGALLVDGTGVIVASANGTFARLDPATWTYAPDDLPALPDLGDTAIKSSKRYRFQELLPRVHGLAALNGTYFVSYDQYRAGDDRVTYVIAELKRPAKAWTEVWRSPGIDAPYYAVGGGGVMAASASDDRLYFAVGDYSLDTINHLPSDIAAQNPDLPFGKVNYIDLKDNSFHPYTLGHRNPLGLAFLSDGRLIESENGPKGGDELNLLALGKNYGWPYESYGTHYGSDKFYREDLTVPAGQTYEQPLYVWNPAIVPGRLVQVSGFDPNWDGNVLLASLSGSLYNIKLVGDRVLYCEPIDVKSRARDLVQFGKTFLLLTDTSTIVEIKKN